MKPIRVVVDTNVIIDAIISGDESCISILKHKHDGDILFCMNKSMYNELIYVFARLLEKIKLEREIGRLFPKLGNTLWEIQHIERKTHSNYCIGDDDDNKFVDCCIDGKVQYLITNDMHIREVQKELEDIKSKYGLDLKVMSPYQFTRELLKLSYKH